jgi:stage V sporulation protein R
MSARWSLADLERWDARIRERIAALGLSCFPQEFDVCDQEQMLGYMSYSGMPAHYPHWSYGKSFEKQKTLYGQGASALPYELVINANPSLAYLMRDNSLCLQILTIAHVYGHNDFFRNNATFRGTRPEQTLEMFKVRADRVRAYVEDPSIGIDAVESVLDAAHALALQCRRNLAIRKLSQEEHLERTRAAGPPEDPFHRIHKPAVRPAPQPVRLPFEPDEDLLLFIRDHNRDLAEWEKDLLTIVHEQTRYFVPQIETKIMNEGWATYWHHQVLCDLDLPPELHLEFLVHHSQVVRPHPGRINPYLLGYRIWEDIRRRGDRPTPQEIERNGPPRQSGLDLMFEVRESDRDVSFLRRFLTAELMRDMDLYEYARQGDKIVVSAVSDEQQWQRVKDTLLANVGMGPVPVVRVVDADYARSRQLCLEHVHDGRDLDLEYAERTLGYVYRLWGRPVLLHTIREGVEHRLAFDGQEFTCDQAQDALSRAAGDG